MNNTTPADEILDKALDIMLDELLEVGRVLDRCPEEEEDPERWDGME